MSAKIFIITVRKSIRQGQFLEVTGQTNGERISLSLKNLAMIIENNLTMFKIQCFCLILLPEQNI